MIIMDSSLQDDCFTDATQFVEDATALGIVHFDEKQKLTLYGLFKRATCGAVTSSQPAIFQPRERVKWGAWKDASGLSETEAKERYIALVTEWCPDWHLKEREVEFSAPVFSRLVEDLSTTEDDTSSASKDLLQELQNCADEDAMVKVLNQKSTVVDTSERTTLHWAADEGCLQIAEVLVRSGYDVNARDNDQMTPLHYSVLCGHQQLAYKLGELGARWDLEDSSGETPQDLMPSDWTPKTE